MTSLNNALKRSSFATSLDSTKTFETTDFADYTDLRQCDFTDYLYFYLLSLVNFEPSSVRLYISPFWPKTNPTMGSFIFAVSREAAAPRFTRATDPSTPAFHPELSRNLLSASSCIKTRMMSFFCPPSWKPYEADAVL